MPIISRLLIISLSKIDQTPLSEASYAIRKPLYIDSSSKVFDVLDLFQTGKAHLAVVSKNCEKLLRQMNEGMSPSEDCAPCGILTLEDILEHMLQEPIYDEEDYRITKNKRGRINHSAFASVLDSLSRKSSNDFLDADAVTMDDSDITDVYSRWGDSNRYIHHQFYVY